MFASDALLQHLPSYLGFSYFGRGVSLHGCSSKVQPLLLTLDEGYLLTATLPDLQRGIAPLGPPAPAQPQLLGHGVGPPGIYIYLYIYISQSVLKEISPEHSLEYGILAAWVQEGLEELSHVEGQEGRR